jgi:serine/threonine protein kinase
MADYQVGSGGCSIVFGAELHQGVVAVKVLSRSRDHFTILRREIGILMRIRHPHVLLMLGAVTRENPMGLAIVSEMCMGGSVFHRIFQENNPAFTTRTGLVVAGQVGSALTYLHSINIQHRDVKASNVFLLCRDLTWPHAKLGDFGQSRLRQSPDGQQTPGTDVGTAGYMAPEMMSGETYGTPADVYAFGLFVYEVLVRERAWTKEHIFELYRQLHPTSSRGLDERADMATILDLLKHANLRGVLPNLSKLDEVLTGGAQDFVKSCLSIDPRQRPNVGQATNVIRSRLAVRLQHGDGTRI